MTQYRKIKAIISGGGTGGHIFPALSIANKLKELNPETEILFVGAEGRMEMEKVPAAGYEIVGLPVAGLQRKLTLSNFALPFKVIRSVSMAKKIIREFKPDIAIGVGGYASAPLLWAAGRLGVPTLIQEQNGFAGLTNKILGKKADCICVAYDGMERFFPADKIVFTGNPIRKEIVPATAEMKAEAYRFYGLDPHKKHLFIVGGSLGSGTLNNAMKKWITDGCPGGEDMEIIWQCGKYYKPSVDAFMKEAAEKGLGGKTLASITHSDFIKRMDLAYAAADVVISRSGASSISELCAAHKAAIFVPSPNVTEDHQTHNAMALVNKDAGLIVKDSEAAEKLMETACGLIDDPEKIALIEKNVAALAKTDAAMTIAEQVYRII
ncbi:MAG: undecaprenyldiphospho-muramoylpentapeptide beta-N-acetylglucosaminyltransferase [Bacteroidales bacterium]|nr:undecaprenyldiphospho-muramoylpentapeptide beta-N-acetylglucosaminyltransferase [Bacteroidales bacterium]